MEKKIHYIWLGKKEKPKKVLKCIDSWKKFFPDWQIIEWNETNVDISMMPFVQQAVAKKKYAFASDALRSYILYHYGGLYFDVDVEVLKPFDDLANGYGAFAGFETEQYLGPGLVFYSAEPGNRLIGELLDEYATDTYLNSDGSENQRTIGERFTDILEKHGLKRNGKMQTVDGFTVFPVTYFNPLSYDKEWTNYSDNTYSVHWYLSSWVSRKYMIKKKLISFYKRLTNDHAHGRQKNG